MGTNKEGPGDVNWMFKRYAFKEAKEKAEAAFDRVQSVGTAEIQKWFRDVSQQLADIVVASGRASPSPYDIQRIHESGRRKYFLNLFGVAWGFVRDSNDECLIDQMDAILDSLDAIANTESNENRT